MKKDEYVFDFEEPSGQDGEKGKSRENDDVDHADASLLPVDDVQTGQNPQNNPKKGKKIGAVLLAVGIGVGCFCAGFGVYPLLMDSEIRSLLKIKNIIQEKYYWEITDEEFYSALFAAVNEDVLDDYSAYMTEEEFSANQTEAAGTRTGIGVTFQVVSEDDAQSTFLYFVCGNSPAEKAGLQRGDEIVAVGLQESDMIALTSYQQLKTFLESQSQGAPFYLTYSRGGTEQTVQLSREVFEENYVYYRTGSNSYAFGGQDATELEETQQPLTGLPEDTAYIRLTKFNGKASAQFSSAMTLFQSQNMKHLVLDLRGNGGGYMNILSGISSYFCKTATDSDPLVASAKYKDGTEYGFYATRNLYHEYFSADSRIYLLADADSASASECLIGCMIDYGALQPTDICLVEKDGTAKTYGKGIMQTTYTFGLGVTDAIRLTTAQIEWPLSSRCIHGIGLTGADGCKSTPYVFDHDGEIYGGLTALGITV